MKDGTAEGFREGIKTCRRRKRVRVDLGNTVSRVASQDDVHSTNKQRYISYSTNRCLGATESRHHGSRSRDGTDKLACRRYHSTFLTDPFDFRLNI